jgi:hypothetical protein
VVLDAEAKSILEAVKAGNFLLKTHASTRSLERELPIKEIQHIAETAFQHRWQVIKATHEFIGKRSDGKGAGFSAKLDASGVWVITVFKRTLKKKETR